MRTFTEEAVKRAPGRATVLASPTGLDRKTLSGPSLFMMSASAPLTGVISGLDAAHSFDVPAACLAVPHVRQGSAGRALEEFLEVWR